MSLPNYARILEVADQLFADGAKLLRQSQANVEADNLRVALEERKLAYGALENAHSYYCRASHSASEAQLRRRDAIRRIVHVNVHFLSPLPLPEGIRADQHAFRMKELMTRGRVAVRRSQVTAGAVKQVSEVEMKRDILDKAGDWKSAVHLEVAEVRKAAAAKWRDFCRAAAHPVAGWRAAELLTSLPEFIRRQTGALSAALSPA